MQVFLFFLFWSSSFWASSAGASDVPETPFFIWDNASGFIEQKDCSFFYEDIELAPLKLFVAADLSQKENLSPSENGEGQAFVPPNSMVQVISDGSDENQKKIKVVGFSQSEEPVSIDHLAQRGDEGFVDTDSLRPLDQVIFLMGDSASGKSLGDLRSSIDGTFWKAHMRASETDNFERRRNYYYALCEDRPYFLFSVNDPQSEKGLMAFVGVGEDTELFQSFRTLSPERAARLYDSQRDRAQSAESGSQKTDEESIDNATLEVIRPQDHRKALASIDTVTCTEEGVLNVRNLRADTQEIETRREAFQVRNFIKVKIFNGKKYRKKGIVEGEEYTFVRVQFPEVESPRKQQGWVAQKYLVDRDSCNKGSEPRQERAREERTDLEVTQNNQESSVDGEGFMFPTVKRPTDSYMSGMPSFGASRSLCVKHDGEKCIEKIRGGRKHAASDLYRRKNDRVLAITGGRVLRAYFKFYQGTYAIDTRHDNGFIARYGEITGDKAPGIKPGARVSKGQTIGYIGKVNSGCCKPMLHFELYEGSLGEGSLKSNSGKMKKYQRRADLMNPGPYLQKWECEKFGRAYGKKCGK